MTAAAPSSPTFADPPRAYWTADQFHDLCDSGWFGNRKVFLVDGEILEVPVPNPDHDIGVTEAYKFLSKTFPDPAHYVRNQQGFNAGLDTDPGPDLAVVKGQSRDYRHGHPTEAVLIVEVSDTSLAYDRRGKMHIYAAAGVPEYWVLDVAGRQLLVFLGPVADPTAERAHRYATQLTLGEGDTASPQAAPAASVMVRDLLP